jgi:hypothetical protein
MSGEESDSESLEMYWSGYLIDPMGSGDFAFLFIEDENMTTLNYIWMEDFTDPNSNQIYCVLIPDWKNSSNVEDGVYGFEVTDPFMMCPHVADGWTYT